MVRGLPDFHRFIFGSFAELMSSLGQARWYYTATIAVPALSTATTELWTVPAGDQLYMEHVTLSCDVYGVVQYCNLIDESYIFQHFFFNCFAHTKTLYPLNPGRVLSIYLENWDSVERTFKVDLHGYTARA